jgi:glucose uptake protein GlcU
MSVLTVLVAEEAARPLLFPAPVFGLIALGIFFILGVAMFSYRDVANRHSHKSNKSDHSGGHH